jgi:adiponectin receptor
MASTSRLRVSPPQAPETHKMQGDDSVPRASMAGRPHLLSFDEMPEWFRRESNRWVLHGYRPISGSARVSFSSWSYIHNESVNIYSHLIPAVLFLLGEWYLQQYFTSRYPVVTGADFIAFSIFMLSAVTCLSLSATYHTMMNHSQHMEHLCLRLDMLG